MNFLQLEEVIGQKAGTAAPAIQLAVSRDGELVFSKSCGYLDPETRCQPTQMETRFDMASVTKLFTTTAFMCLVEAGMVKLDTHVNDILPEFSGERDIRPYEDPMNRDGHVDVSAGAKDNVDAGSINFYQLLTHSSGLPAWRPLETQPDANAARRMVMETFFSYQPDARLVYSDIGLILTGMAIERIYGHALDDAVHTLVLEPLNLRRTGYYRVGEPFPPGWVEDAAPTEFCSRRKRRIRGEVHDENAWRLGGVAGHAGVFSTALDMLTLGQMYLNEGAPLLKRETVREMTCLQGEYQGVRKGIGFDLWRSDPEAISHPFGQQSFGHTGFTGTSLWVDPGRSLVVALLTNEVYNGRENRRIQELRLAVHRAVVQAVDEWV
jgi:CubicO group peptidase (beta-lactamase class C family)